MSECYPHSPDDEVRALFYGVKDSTLIPNCYSISCAGSTITVGTQSDGTLATIVNAIFKCSWPRIMRDYLLLDLPMAVKGDAGNFSIAYRRAQHNKDLYRFYPDQLEEAGEVEDTPSWDLDAHLRQFRVALCATLDAEDAVHEHCAAEQTTTEDCTPALAWTLAYDSLMLNVWHNELQEKGVNISFRPRWSAFPATAGPADLEVPVIIPDVVFSVRIPSLHPRLKEAFKYHPAYVFSHGASRPEYLDIPILVVEYQKVVSYSDEDYGIDEHRHHLSSAMAAALPLYSVLGIETPLCGLFLRQYGVDTYIGTVSEEGLPWIHETIINEKAVPRSKQFDLLYRTLDVLHLRTIISNIDASAKSISAELKTIPSSDQLFSCDWAHQALQLAEESSPKVRRAIDVTRPPLVVDDAVLRFLFRSSEDTIRVWLTTANIRIEPSTSLKLPARIGLWLHLFDGPTKLNDSFLSKQAQDIKKGLPDRAHRLLAEFQTACSSDNLYGTSADLSCDVTFALLLCSYAQQLRDIPADPTNNHSRITHWMALYNCLFSRAWRSCEVSKMLARYYPHWTVHRHFREVEALRSDVMNLTEMCPHFAFVFAVEDNAVLEGVRRTAEVKKILPEFTVATHKGTDVQIPVVIVEHVLTVDNPKERAKHLAHLSVALRSALAIWELHHVDGVVLGFLIEQNIVSTVAGWMNESKKCIVSEVSDYIFDVSLPYEAFRFFNLLKMQGSESFAAHMQETVTLNKQRALDALLHPDYVSWQSIHWSHLDEGHDSGADTEGWRKEVAKSTAN